MPMAIAPMGVTKPEAGVIATRPATAPAAAPTTLGLPETNQLNRVQVQAAAAVARWVTVQAFEASPPAARALSALKPNQPNQSIDPPTTTMVMSCGSMGSRP